MNSKMNKWKGERKNLRMNLRAHEEAVSWNGEHASAAIFVDEWGCEVRALV